MYNYVLSESKILAVESRFRGRVGLVYVIKAIDCFFLE